QLALGTLLVTGSATLGELLALQALAGASFAFFTPASAGLVPQTVAAEQLQQANGLMSVARYSAYVFGAAAGGALVATIGPGWATVLTGEALGALAGALAGIRVKPRRSLLTIGLIFLVTDLQLVLLAAHAPLASIAVAAALAGFAFSFGSVIFETAVQRGIEP